MSVFEPQLTPLGERVYEELEPIRVADALGGWVVKRLAGAAAAMLDDLYAVVYDDTTGVSWSALLDAERAPVAALPWLAQLVGARIPTGADETTTRSLIENAPGLRRGTPAAIIGAAQTTLTGNRRVLVYERDGGNAYQLRVATFGVDTPDQNATLAALQAAKPAGLVLTYEVRVGQDWAHVKSGNASWAFVKVNYPKWDDVRSAP